MKKYRILKANGRQCLAEIMGSGHNEVSRWYTKREFDIFLKGLFFGGFQGEIENYVS